MRLLLLFWRRAGSSSRCRESRFGVDGSGLGWLGGRLGDGSLTFAGFVNGDGAGLGGFPSDLNPFFVLFGARGTKEGRPEIGGWFLAGAEVGVDHGFIIEALGEVPEGHHAGIEERMFGGCGFFTELLGTDDVAVFVLNVGFDPLAVDETALGDVVAGETESIDVRNWPRSA